MTFRLFVSHSSPSERSRGRLEELCTAITGRAAAEGLAVQVLLDRDQIRAGDEWRRRIALLLHLCHGGVAVLDEAALDSRWVLAETTFLSLRHAADPSFPFIPVTYLDEPSLEAARRRRTAGERVLRETTWDVVALPDVQYVEGLSPDEVAAGVVTAVRLSGASRPVSPVDRLVDQLGPLLAEAGPGVLRELAAGLEDAAAYLSGDERARAAAAIVRCRLREGTLAAALVLMDVLGSAFDDDKRRKILEELTPLSVANEAGEMLTRRRVGGGYAHASISADLPAFTVPLHIRRAHLARRPPAHFPLSNIHGTVEELLASLRDAWRRRFMSGAASCSDEEVDRRLLASTRDVYVWVPGPVDGAVIEHLGRRYPRLAFILHHEEGQEPPTLPAGVFPVTPAFSREQEQDMLYDYQGVMGELGEFTP